MLDHTPHASRYGSPERLLFPDDEQVHPWLSRLLDAYHIADEGVSEGIRREEKQGKKLACKKGCSSCCQTHKTIPVYPLELVGMSWYATEKIGGPVRHKLKGQLRKHKDGEACPFLVDSLCSIHPMRPLACRQFNVFGRVCSDGEDAYYTRRQDVLTPLKRYTDEAFYIMLPFYGVEKSSERRKVIKTGSIHQIAKVMQSCNWTTLADKMDAYDRRNP
jgi:Fe-S-cluster containining protein